MIYKYITEILGGITLKRVITNNKADRQPFSVWLTYWLEAYVKPTATIGTYNQYKQISERHIFPELGEVAIGELGSGKLRKFFLNKSTDGGNLSEKAIKSIHTVLKGALEAAVESGIISTNHSDKMELPKCELRPERFFDVSEQRMIECAVIESCNVASFGVMLVMYTGARKNELLNLKWSDVDKNKLSINLGGRIVPMAYMEFDKLMEYKKEQHEAMGRKSLVQTADTYVIANCNFEKYSNNGYNSVVRRIAALSGIDDITLCGLRNTFFGNCINAGIDIATMSYIMGDSRVGITNDRFKRMFPQISE